MIKQVSLFLLCSEVLVHVLYINRYWCLRSVAICGTVFRVSYFVGISNAFVRGRIGPERIN